MHMHDGEGEANKFVLNLNFWKQLRAISGQKVSIFCLQKFRLRSFTHHSGSDGCTCTRTLLNCSAETPFENCFSAELLNNKFCDEMGEWSSLHAGGNTIRKSARLRWGRGQRMNDLICLLLGCVSKFLNLWFLQKLRQFSNTAPVLHAHAGNFTAHKFIACWVRLKSSSMQRGTMPNRGHKAAEHNCTTVETPSTGESKRRWENEQNVSLPTLRINWRAKHRSISFNHCKPSVGHSLWRVEVEQTFLQKYYKINGELSRFHNTRRVYEPEMSCAPPVRDRYHTY